MAGIWGDPHSYVGEGVKTYGDLITARLNKSKAVEQEEKNPYVGQRELEALLMDRLKNKYYGPDKESEIGLRGAQASHLNKETSWMDRNNTSLNAYRDMETKLNKQKYDYPGMTGSGAEHTAAVRQILLDRGGQPAVEAHSVIQQSYPDAPLKDTVAMAIQVANQTAQQAQESQQSQIVPMAKNISNSLMQQPSQQSIGRTPQIPELPQALNNVMQPQQPDVAKTTAQKNQIEIDNDIIDADLAYKRQVRGGVDVQKQQMLIQNLIKDNPWMTPEVAFEAADRMKRGYDTLEDGRAFKTTELTKTAADVVDAQGKPAAVRSGNIQANQADAEIKVLKDYTQKALKPYGRTYFDKSPKAIIDSFKSDEDSQRKLGRLIAAQQLQYDIAQNQLRINGGKPGVRSTEELLEKGKQSISENFPTLSYTAREEAQNYAFEALSEGLKERNRIAEHPYQIGRQGGNSGASQSGSASEKKRTRYRADAEGNLVAIES